MSRGVHMVPQRKWHLGRRWDEEAEQVVQISRGTKEIGFYSN